MLFTKRTRLGAFIVAAIMAVSITPCFTFTGFADEVQTVESEETLADAAQPADEETDSNQELSGDGEQTEGTDQAEENEPTVDSEESENTEESEEPEVITVAYGKRTVKAKHTLQLSNTTTGRLPVVSWKSSNTKVASVTASGKLTAKKLGTSILKGYDENGKLRKQTKITVVLGSDYTLFVAHKGYCAKAPVNTLPAFREAVNAGFGGIELDVWESRTTKKSSKPLLLVCHDKNLKHLTGKNKKTCKVNWANRKYYKICRNVKGLKKYGPQKIPSIDEAIKCIYKQANASGKKDFIVEIDVKNKLSDRAVKHIIRVVGKHKIHILCSNIETLKKFKKYRKFKTTEIWCCTGSNSAKVRNKKITSAGKAGFDGISLPMRNVSVKTIRKVRSYGMKMGMYDVRTAAQVQKYRGLGCVRFNMYGKVFYR